MATAMHAIELDDFNRADGALGSTSLTAEPWTSWTGTPVISGNAATGGAAYVESVAFTRGVSAVVSGTGASSAMVGLYDWPAAGDLVGVHAEFGLNRVSFAVYDGSGTSSWTPHYIDLSAGTAEIRVQLDSTTGFDWDASLWVNGTEVWNATVLDSGWMFDNGGASRIGWRTIGSASVDWIAGLEVPRELGQWPLDQIGGLEFRFWPFDGVILETGAQPPQTGGLQAPVETARFIQLGYSEAPLQRGGIATIWTNGPAPALPPGWPAGSRPPWQGVGAPPADLTVVGYPNRTAVSCRPAMNTAGTGSLTVVPPGPALGDVITFMSGGSAVMTGSVTSLTTPVAVAGEEAATLITAEVTDLLSTEWTDSLVWPDFGAMAPLRLGQPAQDDREWGWPMNGLLTPESLAGLSSSQANDPALWGNSGEVLPIPSDWPDCTARWMWATSPDSRSQPRGWCHFRVPFGAVPGRYALFLNAYDYARLWVDGALVGEVTTPGQTARFDVDIDWDFHLVAISAWNDGGPAGVMFSAMRKSDRRLGIPEMNSRSGWYTLAYPEGRVRATTGRVLRRLVAEAQRRGAPAGQWRTSFTDTTDSAGRPWPTNGALVTTRTGQTMWDVLASFAEDRIDFFPSPAGRILHAFVKGTGGDLLAMPWTAGVDAESLVGRLAAT